MSASYDNYDPIGPCGLKSTPTQGRWGKLLSLIFLWFGLMGAGFEPLPAFGETGGRLFKDIKHTIAIDPGHGGPSVGSRGPLKTLEKTITLKLARMLTARLEKEYRVISTRNDDYRVDILNRSATANHFKADIFISLHAGGSFLHQPGGISIFYFNDETIKQTPPAEVEASASDKTEDTHLWDHIQAKHGASSKKLAQSILTALTEQKTAFKCKMGKAPLLVLEGADMPAILIEVGYLSNPSEEKALKDRRYTLALINGIAKGIDSFFKKP
jgi:N-acetylmuramoyl-L-alanine amidase